MDAVGKSWSPEEESKLIAEVRDGRGFKDIALEHGRTPGAIRSRLAKIAASMVDDGKSVHEASSALRVDPGFVENAVKYAKAMHVALARRQVKNNTSDEIDLLKDIRDLVAP